MGHPQHKIFLDNEKVQTTNTCDNFHESPGNCEKRQSQKVRYVLSHLHKILEMVKIIEMEKKFKRLLRIRLELWSPYLCFPSWLGMIVTHYHNQALVEMGSHEHFCLDLPQTAILQISTYKVGLSMAPGWEQF